jgi:hypothetical protein
VTEQRPNGREAIRKAVDRAVASAARKSRKREEKTPGYYLMLEWYRAMRKAFPEAELKEKWTVAELSVAKNLVREVGGERATALVRHLIETWKRRATGRGEEGKGLPSIGFCWAIRERLAAELDGTAEVPVSKGEKLREWEFDEEVAASHPKFGWG